MVQKLTKTEEGFTIIEVLIVLAIAGLIMIIVFLGVPALQRNSRNNARNSDASRIVGAIQSCLSARNNQVGACVDDGDDGNDQNDIQPDTLTQLLTIDFGLLGFSSLTDATYDIDGAYVMYNAECNAAGDAVVANSGGPVSKFAVTYGLENGINRCIAG